MAKCARCGKANDLAPDGTCWPCAVEYRDEIIDAARAPDTGLRAAAADVLARFGGYGRGYWSDEDEDALVALRDATRPAEGETCSICGALNPNEHGAGCPHRPAEDET